MPRESAEFLHLLLSDEENLELVEQFLKGSPLGAELRAAQKADSFSASELRPVLQAVLGQWKDLRYALNQFSIFTVTDLNGVIIDANDRFCEMLRYTREELVGQTHRIVNSGVHPRAFFEQLWATILAGDTWSGEICDRAKDKSLLWMDCVIVPLMDSQHKPYRFMAFRTDITEKVRLRQELDRQLYYDNLTGLANRILLNKLLQREVASRSADGNLLAVIFAELRKFKDINDHLGYALGDKLLVAIAQRLQGFVHPGSTVARFGGDEFVVLQEVTSAGGALAVGKQLQSLLEQPFVLDDIYELHVNVSVGISLFPADATTAEDLIRTANIALNRSKEDPRHAAHVHSPSASVNALKLFTLANDLAKALRNGELQLYFQPQVSLNGGTLMGAEALVRWQHPDWGLVSPEEFIPIAEETGLIVELTEWVLRSAAAQWAKWVEAGFDAIRIAVNFSARDLTRKDLLPVIQTILQATGMEARWLDVEITETMVVTSDRAVYGTLQDIRQLGAKIALDDFGTGYSSLTHLRSLPADILKVDKSFISQCDSGHTCSEIIKAVIQLAHALNLSVIAEGVETEEQAAFLRLQQCDSAQGYLFSRAVPAEEFTEMLRRTRYSAQTSIFVPTREQTDTVLYLDERRRKERLQLQRGLKAAVQIQQIRQRAVQADPTEVVLDNVGWDGIALYSNVTLPVSQHVTFQLTVHLLGVHVAVRGWFVWAQDVEENVFKYGFRLLTNAAQQKEIRAFLQEVRRRWPQSSGWVSSDFVQGDIVEYLQQNIPYLEATDGVVRDETSKMI